MQWSIEDPDTSRVGGVTFSVDRSGSPGGPWEVRAEGLDRVHFTDQFRDALDDTSEENLLALSREVWYRVRATLDDGTVLTSAPVDNYGTLPTVFSHVDSVGLVADRAQNMPDPQSSPFNPRNGLNGRLQLVQRAIQRRAIINLQFFSGVQFAVLKQKHFGKRCVVCFDPATKSILISACKNCYGTGWEGGFYEPILTVGKISEAPLQAQTEPMAQTEIVASTIELLDFPRLEKKDILIELDNNRRWIVDLVADRMLRRRRITQTVQCKELGRTAVAYNVPINRAALKEMLYAQK